MRGVLNSAACKWIISVLQQIISADGTNWILACAQVVREALSDRVGSDLAVTRPKGIFASDPDTLERGGERGFPLVRLALLAPGCQRSTDGCAHIPAVRVVGSLLALYKSASLPSHPSGRASETMHVGDRGRQRPHPDAVARDHGDRMAE
jgi:hypothetical protein